MPSTIWLNGDFVDPAQARVSAFDAALQHAVGLFETMLAVPSPDGPLVIGLDDHLKRIADSGKHLALTESLNTAPLAQAITLAVVKSELVTESTNARVRLTITGGDLNLLTSSSTPEAERTPTILIHVTPAQQYPPVMFERGVGVTIADARANPLNPFEGHKTLNYWWRLRELQVAASKGAGEAIILQVSNHLCGGAVSNLFIVKEGTLFTPIAQGEEQQGALPSPVLPGVTRAQIIELAEHLGVGTSPQMLSVDDLLDADEVFLTNSSWGVLPVVKVEAEAIGDGVPGRLTKQLRERWLDVVAGE